MTANLLPTMKKQVILAKAIKGLRKPSTESSDRECSKALESSSVDLSPSVSQDQPSGNNWRYPYVLPEMSPSQERPLTAKDPRFKMKAKTGIRNQLIQRLFDDLVQKAGWYPSRSQYSDVLNALTTKYPFLKEANESGYELLLESLKQKFKMERRQLTSDDTIKAVREKFSRPGSGRKRKADVLPNTTIVKAKRLLEYTADEGEDEHSLRGHEEFLKEEWRKLRPSITAMKDRAARSEVQRRPFLMSSQISTIMERFPWLQMPQMLLHEMQLLKRTNLDKAILSNLAPLVSGIIKKAPNSQMKTTLLSTVEDTIEELEKKATSANAVLALIPGLFKEDTTAILAIDEDPKYPTPTLVLSGCGSSRNPLKATKAKITINGVTVVQDDSMDMTLGFACLMATYWVYSIEYPTQVKNTYALLEYYITGLDKSKKPAKTVMRVFNML